jgi:hypothetical protein
MASEPDQRQPALQRQGEEQPPDALQSPDENWKRRVVRKVADVAAHIAAAVVENLTP